MAKTVSEVTGCDGCPMRRLFPENKFVQPSGHGKVLVIGDSASEDDARLGEPLVGGSGRWFTVLAAKAGIRRADMTICGTIQCHPPKDVFPTDLEAKAYISKDEGQKAVDHCVSAHVLPLLKAHSWNKVILLGDHALEAIGERYEGIHKWRGSPIAIPALGPKPIAIATLHPSDIAKNQELIPCVINDLGKNPLPPPEYYKPFPSLAEVKAFTATEFAFDIETTYWHPRTLKMVGLSDKSYNAICVPATGAYMVELKRIFGNAKSVIGHNSVQFDLPELARNGITISSDCVSWDTMLMQHLCFPTFLHDLEFVGTQFTNKPAWKHEKGVEEVYCCRDVDVTYQCWKQLKPMLKREGLENLFLDVQVPLGKICFSMQQRGFTVDTANIEKVREKLIKEMAIEELHLPEPMRTQTVAIRKREPAPPGTLSEKTKKPIKFIMVDATEEVIPWRSPAKKQAYLYSNAEPWMLNLPVQVDVKTGRISTGKLALDRLFRKTKNRALMALKALNKYDELITTFCKEEMVHVTQMHPHFNVHGTASGRLSSSDPNLQNIPESTRFIYVPSHAGWKILEVDYSQIENRLTAYFAGDHERLERFMSIPGFSEHKFAAALFMGVPYDEVEKSSDPESPYIKAKKIVHGTNYGEGSKKISLVNDLDFKEVKELHSKWKDAIRATITWQNLCGERAKTEGFLQTPFGRRRYFYTSSYYTEALSFLPQSTAADIIFRAMIALMHERIGLSLEKTLRVVQHVEALPKPVELLLQVHDSLIFEYPPEIEAQLISTVKRVMEQPWPELGGFSIPIGIKVGPSWGEAEEYHGPIS